MKDLQVHPIIKRKFDQLVVLCRKYRVNRLYAFGSVVTGECYNEIGDIDLIVELESLPPLEKGENLLSLWTELEKLYGMKVDLLTDKPIRNQYLKKSIERTKKLIYERKGEKISV